jgi:hypothetical protein
MNKAKELSEVIDKVSSLKSLQKQKEAALLDQLVHSKVKQIDIDGRVYSIKIKHTKPSLSTKFMKQLFKTYNDKHSNKIPDDVLSFISAEQTRLRKKPKTCLSIKKST